MPQVPESYKKKQARDAELLAEKEAFEIAATAVISSS